MTHSIEEYCLDVNPSNFKMPHVVLKQRSRCHKLVFVQLYLDSDGLGKAVLNADLLSAKLKISRRAVYNSLLFLKRVNLLQVLEERRGRGNHSLVKLLWRKPAARQNQALGAGLSNVGIPSKVSRFADQKKPFKGNSSPWSRAREKSPISGAQTSAHENLGTPSARQLDSSHRPRETAGSEPTNSAHDRKCASLSIKDIKTSYLRYDRVRSLKGSYSKTIQKPKQQKPTNDDPVWNRKMRGFRELLDKSWLLPYERRICAAVLGRYIKKKTTEFARALYEQLAKHIHKLDAPNWVRQIKDLCKWFMGVLVGSARVAGVVA